MRIVIDMQAAQGGANQAFEEAIALGQTLARERGTHEVWLALNGDFQGSIEPLRGAFEGVLPQENIRVWYRPGGIESESLAPLLYDAFIRALRADVLVLASVAEGLDLHRVLLPAPGREPVPTVRVPLGSTQLPGIPGLEAAAASARAPKPAADEVLETLCARIRGLRALRGNEVALTSLAEAIAANQPQARRPRLYVDMSEVLRNDLKTGIQRVARSVLGAWLAAPPERFEVVPVFATPESRGYFHATGYGEGSDLASGMLAEAPPIDPQPGDVFLGLDFVHSVVVAQQGYLEWLRNHGVQVCFVVYDLLPLRLPQFFDENSTRGHEEWLEIVARFNGAFCISRAVQDDLEQWIGATGGMRHRRFRSGWFHLGADVENSKPSKGLPADADEIVALLQSASTFLMVGTVEPRKGHREVLAAFEQLWAQGVDVRLAIVGKKGWHMDEFAATLRGHAELGARLLWLTEVSDEYLDRIYAASTCLIAASEGEGFGLPLIEAARKGLPIIARDIPVFREVAGPHAHYYDGTSSSPLPESVREWLRLHQEDRHPSPRGMPWQTWTQSAQQLLANLQ